MSPSPIRIRFQSAVEIEAASSYLHALSAHLRTVVRPDTIVEVLGVPPGTWAGQQPSALFGHPAIFLAALGPALLRNALQAEREGCDAFVVGTFIEPFLRELRSAVHIPVLSSLEATLLVGCTVARTVGLVTINDALRLSLQESIERHRLGARVGPVLTLDPPLDEAGAVALLADPAAGARAFLKMYPQTAPRGSSEAQAVKAVLDAVSRRIKLYAPPYPGAKMGSIHPEELLTEAKMDGFNIPDLSKYYTNDLIDPINAFDAAKIRAQAKAYKA